MLTPEQAAAVERYTVRLPQRQPHRRSQAAGLRRAGATQADGDISEQLAWAEPRPRKRFGCRGAHEPA
jgi:hypothetical protein